MQTESNHTWWYDGDTITWDDIESEAELMFHYWGTNEGELKWAKECWDHFEAAGLADASNVLEITKTLIRLATLAQIHNQFCCIAWDAGPGDETVSEFCENLKLPPIALGWLASKAGAKEPDEAFEDSDLINPAIDAVGNALRLEIHTCLVEAYGSPMNLYSRMLHTSGSEPEDVDESDDPFEFEPTAMHEAALMFVENGFYC